MPLGEKTGLPAAKATRRKCGVPSVLGHWLKTSAHCRRSGVSERNRPEGGAWRGDGGIHFCRAFQICGAPKRAAWSGPLGDAGDEARTRYRHPANGLKSIRRNPAGPQIKRASGTGGGSEFVLLQMKRGHPDLDVLLKLERATRLELATSTLARWRSTR